MGNTAWQKRVAKLRKMKMLCNYLKNSCCSVDFFENSHMRINKTPTFFNIS